MRNTILAFVAVTSLCLSNLDAQTPFTATETDDGVQIRQGNQVVAVYVKRSFSKPIIYPLIGPTGAKMTRDYPMVADSKDEAHDHPHHRSLWFTHGEVNGVDFWLEGEHKDRKGGEQIHQAFTQVAGGEKAVVASTNLWKSPAGETVLSDRRRFTFAADADARWVDCEVQLIASHGDVHFGDTKEGSFGVRVAESMKVEAKKGGKIINSAGETDGQAWGRPADWVDYFGPVGNETVGLAIFCHPTSFHHPTRWHVRTYGLFAANPFGVYHFTGDKQPTDGVRLPKGESLTLRYRVLMHKGDEKTGRIVERYQEFAKQEFQSLEK